MKYNNIYIEQVSSYLPPHVIKSEHIEDALKKVYNKFNFSKGRLELFTGIKERKAWDEGTLPSQVSSQAGKIALEKSNISPEEIDVLIHSSVCRNFVEPATSSVVHHDLNLKPSCINFDVSNACLGMISSINILADMIESGHIKRGLCVSGEIGLPLLKQTIVTLNDNCNILTRKEIKNHFASLTIGSAASAIILSHKDVVKDFSNSFKLLALEHHNQTNYNTLCQEGTRLNKNLQYGPLMSTDSEKLLKEGIKTAKTCWNNLLENNNLTEQDIAKVCSHQVGKAHQKYLYEQLKINPNKDYSTFEHLGNCGSSSLPITLAEAIENKHFTKKEKIALLAIGSGINCTMAILEF